MSLLWHTGWRLPALVTAFPAPTSAMWTTWSASVWKRGLKPSLRFFLGELRTFASTHGRLPTMSGKAPAGEKALGRKLSAARRQAFLTEEDMLTLHSVAAQSKKDELLSELKANMRSVLASHGRGPRLISKRKDERDLALSPNRVLRLGHQADTLYNRWLHEYVNGTARLSHTDIETVKSIWGAQCLRRECRGG